MASSDPLRYQFLYMQLYQNLLFLISDTLSLLPSLCLTHTPKLSLNLFLRYFIAGGLCASLSHGVAVPFDVVKTRLQTSNEGEFKSTNVISGKY